MRLALAVAAALTFCASAHADILIRNDAGGEMHAYESRVLAARASGERVIVDGRCASACTLFLNLPPGQICATARARFVFHSATDRQFGLPDWRANERLLEAYPPSVRYEVMRRGGLWLTPISIAGTALVPACAQRGRR